MGKVRFCRAGTLQVLTFACLLGAAQASPVTIADQLALKTRGVRVDCPVAQCLTLPVVGELARLAVDAALGDTLLTPWRESGDTVSAEVKDGTGRAVVTLRQISDYGTRVEVSPSGQPVAQGQRVEYAGDLRMLFGYTRTGPLLARYQSKTAPLTTQGARAYLAVSDIRLWGCTVTPLVAGNVRVTCPYPNLGTLSADVPLAP